MGFWQNVDEELKFSGMSRKELAAQADFPDSYISKGIKRNSIPSADLAVRIAHALHISVENLLDMEEAKTAENRQSRHFLTQWNSLSKEQQQKLSEFLDAMAK